MPGSKSTMDTNNINLKNGEKPVVVAPGEAPQVCENVAEAARLAAEKARKLQESGGQAGKVEVKQQLFS